MIVYLATGIIPAAFISGIISLIILRRHSATIKAIVFILVFVLYIWVEYKLFLEWKAVIRRQSMHTMCANNLKQIHLAINLYRDSNEGIYPNSLVSLYPKYLPDSRVFYCLRLIINWSINDTDMAGVTMESMGH